MRPASNHPVMGEAPLTRPKAEKNKIMKIMKRLVISLAIALLASALGLQTASAQRITLGGGYLPVAEGLRNSTGNMRSSANGFYGGLGVVFDYGLTGWGIRVDYLNIFATDAGNNLYREHALLVPLQIQYTFLRMGYANRLFLYAGPTLEAGLSATLSREGVSRNLYKEESGQNRLNLWLGGGLGLELGNVITFKAGYQQSLLNYWRNPGENANRLSRYMLSVGLEFSFGFRGAPVDMW